MSHYHETAIAEEISEKIRNVYDKAIRNNIYRLRRFRENGWIDIDDYINILDQTYEAQTMRAQISIVNQFFDKLLCTTST